MTHLQKSWIDMPSTIFLMMIMLSNKNNQVGFTVDFTRFYGKIITRLFGLNPNQNLNRILGILLFLYLIIGISGQPLKAQNPTEEPPRQPPLDVKFLIQGMPPEVEGVITANNISESGLTIPSLWWVKEQFAGQILSNWLAYPNDNQIGGRVDLVVNRQVWSSLDYLQRYEFVNHFGMAAKEQQYNTRVFNRQGGLLAAYTCNFNVEPLVCKIWLDASGFQGTRPTVNP